MQNGIKINQNILKRIYYRNAIDLFASIVRDCPKTIGYEDIKDFERFVLQENNQTEFGKNPQEIAKIKKSFLDKIAELKNNHELSMPTANKLLGTRSIKR